MFGCNTVFFFAGRGGGRERMVQTPYVSESETGQSVESRPSVVGVLWRANEAAKEQHWPTTLSCPGQRVLEGGARGGSGEKLKVVFCFFFFFFSWNLFFLIYRIVAD